MTPHAVIIGAGIGGLTAAALLLKAGVRVTVLEQQAYPGGTAGTFYHKGYRFDAGATLAGGFSDDGPHGRLAQHLGLKWDVTPVDPAWIVHIGRQSITQWADRDAWHAEAERIFPEARQFWQLQTRLAQAAWSVSSQRFPFPPSTIHDLLSLAKQINSTTLSAAPYGLRSIASMLPADASLTLKSFVDSQLLISAQTTSQHANALYGSAALDLPRRGVSAPRGGMGSLANTLIHWIRTNGGEVLFHQQVNQLKVQQCRITSVATKQGLVLPADIVIANLTYPSLAVMLGEQTPARLKPHTKIQSDSWGAFMLYLGIDASCLQTGVADHHQIIADPNIPFGEGNSVFVSISPAWDDSRAPVGHRAITISTHTRSANWWALHKTDLSAYAERKEAYTQQVLRVVETVIPNIRAAVKVILPGTPVTFQRFTLRQHGLVGGYPQTSLLAARSGRVGIANLRLVGDSIFPGQSTAGVTLGAMRVVDDILNTLPSANHA